MILVSRLLKILNDTCVTLLKFISRLLSILSFQCLVEAFPGVIASNVIEHYKGNSVRFIGSQIVLCTRNGWTRYSYSLLLWACVFSVLSFFVQTRFQFYPWNCCFRTKVLDFSKFGKKKTFVGLIFIKFKPKLFHSLQEVLYILASALHFSHIQYTPIKYSCKFELTKYLKSQPSYPTLSTRLASFRKSIRFNPIKDKQKTTCNLHWSNCWPTFQLKIKRGKYHVQRFGS